MHLSEIIFWDKRVTEDCQGGCFSDLCLRHESCKPYAAGMARGTSIIPDYIAGDRWCDCCEAAKHRNSSQEQHKAS